MQRIMVSFILTLLLGPGVGHLYLKKVKRGIVLIVLTFMFTATLAMLAIRAEGIDLEQKIENPAQIITDYARSHKRTVLAFDVVFAALWAYAFLDAFRKAREGLPPQPQNPADE